MYRLACIILFLSWNSFSATYYVVTNGNNAAAGGLATPWSNIWYAAKTVSAGDTVNVGPGEFNEFITNTVSGTGGNPITFQGTRSVGGDWLTIVDPSTTISNGWIAAPEIGSGVYKLTNAFDPSEITIDHKRVAYVNTNGLLPGVESAYTSGQTNGVQFLLLATDAIVTNGTTATVFWDSVKVLYGSVSNSATAYTIYMRLRDGSDPSGLNIRVAPNRYNYHAPSMVQPAFHLNNQSFITIRNFKIRGAFGGVFIPGGNNNTVESNSISGGWYRIYIANNTYSNIVDFNSLTTDYYGYDDPGAWANGTNSNYVNRANLYSVSKFLMSPNAASFDGCIEIEASGGSNNVVIGNHIFKGLGTGVAIGNTDPAVLNTVVCSNTIEGMPSVGVHLPYGQTGTEVHHNLISDCNLSLRYHTMNRPGETNRIVYVYRNRLWLPQGISSHIYFNFYTGLGASYWPEYWTYYNSFSGGYSDLDVGIAIADYGIQDLRGCRFLNNVLSGPTQQFTDISSQPAYASFWTNSTSFGAFDYNEYTEPVYFLFGGPPGWQGLHMVTNAVAEWGLTSVPNFALQAGSPAINSALDLTKTFNLNGTNYAALPFGTDQKFGAAWDMGALEFGGIARSTTLRVGTMRMSP